MNFGAEQSLTVFSSEGTLKQCDNALNAALNGMLSLGICTSEGAVIASLKLLPKLIEKQKVHKVVQVCDTIGLTYSGLQADFRIIYNKAVSFVEDYKEVYGRYPFINFFVSNFSRVIQEYTQTSNMRPFGNLIIFVGLQRIVVNHEKRDYEVLMYQIDPYGSFQELQVAAIGKYYDEAKNYLEKRKESIDDNIFNCVKALKEYAGQEISHVDFDIGVLYKKDKIFKVFSDEEKKELYDNLDK
ncbi:Proteasome subunit alpha type-2 [Dictyocoela muelleri]|nr:Proteasome subunit alpha type-2 [Dictyocoela muelleri]